MQRLIFLIVAGSLLATSTSVPAHPGPRVWIGNANGALTTYGSNNDLSPATYSTKRVFIGGMDEDTYLANGLLQEYPVPGTGIFASEYPGFQVRLDGNSGIASGTSFGFNLTGPLLVYDTTQHVLMSTQQKFASPGPVPQFHLSAGDGSVVTGGGPVSGFNFLTYNTSIDHGHLVTTLLGDGVNPVDGPLAVYAVPMQLTSTSYGASSPFYVLYGRGIDSTQTVFQEALQFAQDSLNLPGDANLDGRVDARDLGRLALHWQGTGTWRDGDFNYDGNVDITDAYILALHWQNTTASLSMALESFGLAQVPEPHSALILGSFALTFTLRRKKAHGTRSMGLLRLAKPVDDPSSRRNPRTILLARKPEK